MPTSHLASFLQVLTRLSSESEQLLPLKLYSLLFYIFSSSPGI